MAARKLTDTEIKIRIVPTHLRWPEAGTSVIWRRLHECVQQLHEFARATDNDCIEIEQKREFGRNEIERQHTEVGQEALKKLAHFRPFEIAEQTATKEIDALENREALTPQEAQAKQKLMRAVDELRAGIAATQRLLRERCKMHEGSARHA